MPIPLRKELTASLVFFFIVVMSLPVNAQPSLAIVDITLEGELDPSVVDEVASAVEEGVGEAIGPVLRPDVVAENLRQAGMDTSCSDDACLMEIGALTQTEALLQIRLSATGQSYALEARLVLSRDASTLGRVQATCDVCTWSEALGMITQGALGLCDDLPGFILVTLEPAEATLSVDGDLLPPGIDRFALSPGIHHLEATLDGFATRTQNFELESGEELELEVSLEAGDDRPWWRSYGTWGWFVGGLGLAGLIPGVTLLAIDGNCRSDARSGGGGGCSDTYETWPGGLALSIVGGALIATSMALLALHYSRRRSTTARIARWLLGAGSPRELVVARRH